MVAFEKRYHGMSSDLGFVDFRRLLNIFDIQTKEKFVFGMFQTWNGSLKLKPVVNSFCGISLWLCELSGFESL